MYPVLFGWGEINDILFYSILFLSIFMFWVLHSKIIRWITELLFFSNYFYFSCFRYLSGSKVFIHYFEYFHTYRHLKGTQDWDFFWLRFWNLYYYFISYVKILRFYNKNFFDQAIIGGDTIFPLSLRLSGIEFSLVWD